MKKIILYFSSMTTLLICSENNLNQATQAIIDNSNKLKERVATIQKNNDYQSSQQLTLEQIQIILTAQKALYNSELMQNIAERKTAHQNLQIIAQWFEDEKNADDWINYFAVHNQTIASIQIELEKLKKTPNLCKEIAQRILTAIMQNLQKFYFDNGKPENLKSLIYVYQDYVNLFKK